MVLTYDAYNETFENPKERESEIQVLKEKYEHEMKEIRQDMKEEMREQMAQLLTKLKPDILKQGLS
jgi:F0F1-type ATP synthase membrane subunit b/b'